MEKSGDNHWAAQQCVFVFAFEKKTYKMKGLRFTHEITVRLPLLASILLIIKINQNKIVVYLHLTKLKLLSKMCEANFKDLRGQLVEKL